MQPTRLLLGLLLALAPSVSALSNATNPVALARGLDVIQADAIRSDLAFIASDELQGRDTPSPGLRLAALYLEARVARLGFTPAGEQGFFDPYSLDRVGLDLERTRAWIEGKAELVFGEDYYFRSDGFLDLEAKAPLVYVGDASVESLKGIELAGSYALAWDAPEAQSSARAKRLAEAGALGVLYLQPQEVGYSRTNRVARYAKRQATRGSLRVRKEGLNAAYLTEDGAKKLGLELENVAVGTRLPLVFGEVRARSGDSQEHVVENVAALWPGSDPELAHEVIILSAHYDHVGVDGEEIYNGADDNGSGTCGLLAIADALKEYGPMRRSVLLLWVSGEEKGLKGSYAWTIAPTLPEGYEPICNLNIDMIGRNAHDSLLITPTKERPEYNDLVRMAEQLAPQEGFPTLGSCDEYWRRSDHMNFSENLGLPVAFLFSDVHEDYHRPTDTIEKIDFDKIRRVTRLVLRMLDGLQQDHVFGR